MDICEKYRPKCLDELRRREDSLRKEFSDIKDIL